MKKPTPSSERAGLAPPAAAAPAKRSSKDMAAAKAHRLAPLHTPHALSESATRDMAAELNALLADTLALYFKTRNFHWHVFGPNFRELHLLMDEQAVQIFATVDPLAERVRKLGHTTLRSVGHIARLQRLADNEADLVSPGGMLAELREDNQRLAGFMRATHALCDEHADVATASLLETWIDEAEQRVWFLFETGREA